LRRLALSGKKLIERFVNEGNMGFEVVFEIGHGTDLMREIGNGKLVIASEWD
jgi:hypothetical protein